MTTALGFIMLEFSLFLQRNKVSGNDQPKRVVTLVAHANDDQVVQQKTPYA
jgi:hypothetical protein